MPAKPKYYMLSRLHSIMAILASAAIMCVGHGLLNTVIGLRANIENYSDVVIGAMTSSYFFGFIIGTYICGKLIPKVGHIRCFTIFASVASALTLFLVLKIEPVSWIVARLVYGACAAALYMVMESWLNLITKNEERGQILSFYMITIYIGLAASQGFIFLASPSSYMLFAVASILLSFSLIPVAASETPQPKFEKAENFSLKQLFQTSYLATAGVFTTGLINGSFWGLAPIYLSNIGMPDARVGWFIAFQYLGGLILQWPIGYLSDRIQRRSVIVVMLFASSVVSFYLYSLSYDGSTALFALFLAGAFFFGGINSTVHSLFLAHANDFLKASQVVKASGGLLTVHALGAMIGPLLATLFIEYFSDPGLVLFTACVASTAFFFSIWRLFSGRQVPKDTKAWFVPMPRAGAAVAKLDPRRFVGGKSPPDR